MVFLTEGENRVVDLIDGDIDKAEIGIGTTAENINDTDLESPIASTELSSTSTQTKTQIDWNTTFNALTAVGSDVTEYGMKRSSTELMYLRDTAAAYSKTNTKFLYYKPRIYIRSQ